MSGTAGFLLGLLAGACSCDAPESHGGSAGTAGGGGGSAGTAGGGGGGPTLDACEGLQGSYSVSVRDEHDLTSNPSFHRFSLSLGATVDGCRAVLTPEGYPSASLVAELTADGVILGDSAKDDDSLVATGWYWGLTFYSEWFWQHFVFPRAGQGFAGAAEAGADCAWAEDDVCSVNRVRYVGTILPDDAPPVVEVGAANIKVPTSSRDCFSSSGGERRPGLPDTLLPWDILGVQASEPVPQLGSHVGVSNAATSEATRLTRIDADVPARLDAAETWVWARFDDWDAVSGTSQLVTVREGLTDLAGHPLGALSVPISVSDVGPARESHEFETEMTALALGDTTLEGGHVAATAVCNSGVGGIAGRVLTAGKTKVFFRVQAPDLVVIHVVGRGGPPSGTSTDTYPGEHPGEDGWVTVEHAIEDVPEVGFTVVPNSMCHWTRDTTVLVDRIWAE